MDKNRLIFPCFNFQGDSLTIRAKERRLFVINRSDIPSLVRALIYHACSVNSGNAAEEPLVKSNLIVLLSRSPRPQGVVTLVANRVLSISLTPINWEQGSRARLLPSPSTETPTRRASSKSAWKAIKKKIGGRKSTANSAKNYRWNTCVLSPVKK